MPAGLTSIAGAVQAVASEFDPKSTFRPFGPERWIRDVINRWGDGIQHVAIVLDSDPRLVAMYVILDLSEPAAHGDALARAAARANYGLLDGCFEVDPDTGETRYRNALRVYSDDLTTKEIAELMADALHMAKLYAPAFVQIVEANADPCEAIDAVESAE